MYRRSLAVLALLMTTAIILAQEPKKEPATPPPPRVRGILPKYFKSFGLSDQQKQDIYRVQATYGAKIDALVAQIKALHAEELMAIEKQLTDAQKARLKELKLGETKPAEPDVKKDDGKPPAKP
jgi:hypothetical protein